MPQGQLTEEQRLKQANSRLSNHNAKLKEENKELKSEIKELKENLQSLNLKFEDLTSTVFGKKQGTNKQEPKKKRKKRSKGSYKRIVPTEIDETLHHTIKNCTDCSNLLSGTKDIIFHEEDIVLPKKHVTKYIVEKGFCNHCRKWVSPIKIPTAPVILGETVRTTIVYMSTLLRLSYSQIQDDLRDRFNLTLSQGEISNILQRKARDHAEDYDKLKEKVRQEDILHFDETSDRVGKEKKFTWSMQGAQSPDVIFTMGKSRGKGVALKLYGNSNAIGVTDNYGAYDNLFVIHQLCWAHLHRKLRDLAQSSTLEGNTRKVCEEAFSLESEMYKKVRELTKQKLTQGQRNYWVAVLAKQLGELAVLHKHDPRKLKAYKETLTKNMSKYLTCIKYSGVPPDNNRAERSLRHVVIKRKTSFGHTSEKGAQTMGVLMSVFVTIRNRMKGTDQSFFEAYRGFEV